MNVLFDRYTAPGLAARLGRALPGRTLHVADMVSGRAAPDAAWIAHLRAAGGDWLVVSGDARLHRVPALRLAWRRAGLRAVALGSGYASLGVEAQAALLALRWPEVEAAVRAAAPPCLFELPAERTDALRALPE